MVNYSKEELLLELYSIECEIDNCKKYNLGSKKYLNKLNNNKKLIEKILKEGE